MIKINKKNFFSLTKFTLIVITIVFIFINSKENYQDVIWKINFGLFQIFLILLVRFVIQNLLSFRIYYFLKSSSKYSGKFFQWSYLFFYTSLINISPLWGIGHIFRSYEMKKKNYSYKEYLNMYFFLFFWSMLIYSILFCIILFFYNETNIYYNIAIISILLISSLTVSRAFFNLLYKFFFWITQIKSFKNIKLFNDLFKKILDLINISKNILKLKIFCVFGLLTSLIFFFDFTLLYLIFYSIFDQINLNMIVLFFFINFLSKLLKPLDNIFGFREIIFGFYGEQFGILFFEGVLIAFILRLSGVISIILNSLFYKICKNKFSYLN